MLVLSLTACVLALHLEKPHFSIHRATVRCPDTTCSSLAQQPRRAAITGFAVIGVAVLFGGVQPAAADLVSAGASGLPLLGRFEPLKGAKSFIGRWRLYSTDGPQGELVFLKDGDVELRSEAGKLLGASVSAWTYKSPPKGENVVRVSFTLDVVSTGDVLYFQGAVDSAAGPARTLAGSIASSGRRVGDFEASPLPSVE